MVSAEMSSAPRLRHRSLTEISDGIGSVQIAAEAGGAVASYRWETAAGAINWLRPASLEAIESGDVGNMGCFPLVPYSNRVENSQFNFEGQQVSLPGTPPTDPHFEHGHGWRHPWAIIAQHPDRLVLRYRHAADAWPWAYEAEQAFSLSQGALSIVLTMRNLSALPMPMGFGLHPYFPATPLTRITADVGGMWETDAEVLPTRLVAVPTSASPVTGLIPAQAPLDTVFTGWAGSARIDWPERKASLIMTAERPLNFLTLYTPAGEPYFCAEPVSNITNAFNLAHSRDDTGLIILAPGAAISARVQFTPTVG